MHGFRTVEDIPSHSELVESVTREERARDGERAIERRARVLDAHVVGARHGG